MDRCGVEVEMHVHSGVPTIEPPYDLAYGNIISLQIPAVISRASERLPFTIRLFYYHDQHQRTPRRRDSMDDPA
jgi:hypothetical protein